MAKMIRVGIMGAGYIAGVHASVLARDERCQLVAVYDVVPECAERLAGSHNATAVATTLELLERSDAVFYDGEKRLADQLHFALFHAVSIAIAEGARVSENNVGTVGERDARKSTRWRRERAL